MHGLLDFTGPRVELIDFVVIDQFLLGRISRRGMGQFSGK
jgi:hypothetical protein